MKYLEQKGKLATYQEGNWYKVSTLYKNYNIDSISSFLNNYPIFYDNEIKPHISNLIHINETQKMFQYYVVGYLPQYLFICDDSFNILVNDVVNIKDCDTFMFNKFDISQNQQQRLNTHSHTNDNYCEYLTEKNIEDIKEIYKEDYKYLFNDTPSTI